MPPQRRNISTTVPTAPTKRKTAQQSASVVQDKPPQRRQPRVVKENAAASIIAIPELENRTTPNDAPSRKRPRRKSKAEASQPTLAIPSTTTTSPSPPPAETAPDAGSESSGVDDSTAGSERRKSKGKRKSLSSLTSNSRRSGRASKRLRAESPCSFNEAERGAFIACKNSNMSQATLDKYAVYWKQAVAYVERVSVQERTKAASWSAHESSAAEPENDIDDDSHAHGEGDINEGMEDDLPGDAESTMHPDFALSFTGTPKECTPIAIVMFLWYKCWKSGCKIGVAQIIKSAILQYYNHLDGDKYRGKWEKDPVTGEWRGNPARAGRVDDMMKSLKKKDCEDQPERKHSKAMSYEDMHRIHEYVSSICPPKSATDPKSLALRAECLFYLAFSATGFVIWTRNSETCQLQAKHVDWNAEPKISQDGRHSHARYIVNVRHRKNWTHKIETGEASLDGHLYNIYKQPSTPAIDLYHHLTEWKDFYETHLLRRPLHDDDYLFPKMNPANMTVHPDTHISYQAAQKLITKMATGAGLSRPDRYTTHCFRRGGAQYRFMYAADGRRWTMARIRWWGGWAEKESGITLMKYLLDELSSYENGHQDAMAPEDPDENKDNDSGGGNADRLIVESSAHAHTAGGTSVFTRADADLLYERCQQGFSIQLEGFSSNLFQALRQGEGAPPILPPNSIHAPPPLPLTFNGSSSTCNTHTAPAYHHPPSQPPAQTLAYHPSQPPSPTQYPYPTQWHSAPPYLPTPLSSSHAFIQGVGPSSSTVPSLPPSFSSTTINTPAISYNNYSLSFQFNAHPVNPAVPPQVPYPPFQPTNTLSAAQALPPPRPKYFIPHIDRKAKAQAWSIVVSDWDNGRPPHCPPLHTWRKAWYTETKQEQLYHIRRTIAKEYIEQCSRNTENFLAAYPDYKSGLNALYKAIQRARQARGEAGTRDTG